MEGECLEDGLDMEILSSMWPDDLRDDAKQFMEKPGGDRDMLEDVMIAEEPTFVDFQRLMELTDYSKKGSSQLTYLMKSWEYKQANAVRLLNEEINILSKQREEVELKKLEIIEEHRFEDEKYGDKRPVSILDEVYAIWDVAPRRRSDVHAYNQKIDIDAEYDTTNYWKLRALQLEKLLEESIQREDTLMQKLQENIKSLETQSSPVEELSQILKRADNFLHFVLQNAPVVIGHQDKDLRYRFIYNPFPSLGEEDIIGKTDTEIFTGAGVKENQEFKREVMEKGKPAKREITFETELFGSKTFLIYVEPVLSKTGETIGVNYMGMDITDQVIKREKMAMVREEMAVQKAKETELNKTIHITEETMRAKQMLATMSHEIRSPLTGVVSMAEILSNSKLDKEQRQLLDVMLSSGDLVLQLINDILDLSKVESGVMKLESTKFRPREVVKHVLQTAAASLQKELTLEGNVADGVPIEVIGDVLRIRQILTNLISNAVKFTHEGKVGIRLWVESEQYNQVSTAENFALASREVIECGDMETSGSSKSEDHEECSTLSGKASLSNDDTEKSHHPHEKVVRLRCDVYDTGIGIPEKAIPSLFKKYMQVSADHARKYGGTGLGLAICKQLVELMGGHLTVTSQEHRGSTFTFVLPCKITLKRGHSDDPDEDSSFSDTEVVSDMNTDETNGSFLFKPRTLGTLFSSGGSMIRKTKMFRISEVDPLNSLNVLSERSDSFSSNMSVEDFCSICESTDSNDLESPQTKSERSTHKTKAVSRRDEMCQYNNSNIDSTRTERSSEVCVMRCSGEVITTEYGSQRNKKEPKLQSTSNGSNEVNKHNLAPKILLVEDNKVNIMVARTMMKQLGYSMDVVNNGLEAIHAFQSSHYDLILMVLFETKDGIKEIPAKTCLESKAITLNTTLQDVCMPVMDGLQATRLIRSYEEHGYWDASIGDVADRATTCSDSRRSGPDGEPCRKRTPIIAMTANALSESADECLANGMDSFVSKPVNLQKLKQCLEQYVP